MTLVEQEGLTICELLPARDIYIKAAKISREDDTVVLLLVLFNRAQVPTESQNLDSPYWENEKKLKRVFNFR